ncbi:hypothetical protein QMM44_06300 [Leptospira santarosai]|nr:hypothetical protein [Leptospira santarosai]MDI7203061.1 hypothetical protein [Leptospira santarosai]
MILKIFRKFPHSENVIFGAFAILGHLYEIDFSSYDSRKTATSCRDLILRSLSLDFIKVPFRVNNESYQ